MSKQSANWKLWIAGARPRTLPASVAPVIVGAAAAWQYLAMLGVCTEQYPEPAACTANRAAQAVLLGRFWPVAVLCLIVALALQIAVNYANDYSDGIRGTDNGRDIPEPDDNPYDEPFDEPHPRKPQRLVASGVPARQVLRAAGVAAGIACVAGLAAVIVAHAWLLLAVGALSLLAGWTYTGGRHPYGYAGFGELGVFLFFGLAAVLGTQYALTGTIDLTGILSSICCGLNAMMLLMVNNLRDIDEDQRHGKRTLAVRLGEGNARTALAACVGAELLVSIVIVSALWPGWGVLLMISGIAVPLRMMRGVARHEFRGALMDAGYQTLFFAALIVLCVAVGGL
ncbi:1,4-dihydroxy-2-naphthoate octaprenyltransferase [Bifidobacterium amazonense]|uniref:1,4-dihydroxy-2-naphthoate octaprenyltransferase n=1 Tax=Bifidobacterium amazonense TaxID=2809027 RepID=A0ABS9VYQ3_9BIFI|nr:1,4-dihydroxy-2-naphthoate octaprenyltransferase [Bifidobacterium amazonense]MCH9276935.1 1,4-dihydroxy-2-naphthoate octaprenyltransferase [Bifidobacterium amazonense]